MSELAVHPELESSRPTSKRMGFAFQSFATRKARRSWMGAIG
jgi:hypothetical protein